MRKLEMEHTKYNTAEQNIERYPFILPRCGKGEVIYEILSPVTCIECGKTATEHTSKGNIPYCDNCMHESRLSRNKNRRNAALADKERRKKTLQSYLKNID